MPLPKPRKDETKEQYVARFLKSDAAQEFKTQDQRLAVAYETYRRVKRKAKKRS